MPIAPSRRFSYKLPPIKPGDALEFLPLPADAPPPAPPVKPNRKQRRKAQVFNRQLAARLAKDGTPAKVEIQPDGGIHVSVKKPEDAP